jgi:catechol 2,3-dioxygenase-like lactoylglutathione lyase family enzyme
VAKPSGILGVDHVAIFTKRIQEAEQNYEELFGAVVLFRHVIHRGSPIAVDPIYGWDEIARRGLQVASSFLRAGALTLIVSDEPAGKDGPVNHVGIGCTEPEFRRIRELVRDRRLRVLEEGAGGFKFVDPLGLIWEIGRGADAAKRPDKTLDLGTGRIV